MEAIDPTKLTPLELEAYKLAVDRELGRMFFYHFVRIAFETTFNEPFIDGWHVAATCYHLQALWEGKIKVNGKPSDTLIINEPPGCGKSRIATVLFPAWLWAKSPSIGLWFTSFSQGLCHRDALASRFLLTSDWYRMRFWNDTFLTEDQNTKTRYHNNKSGWRLSASIVARVGFGEHPTIFGIDDPHDPEQSTSEIQRQFVIDQWNHKYSSRGIVKGVKKFIIAQRLHEQDLSGYVLENEDDVCHLWLPMEFEPERRCRTNITYWDIDCKDADGNPKMIEKTQWEDPRTEKGELMWPAGMDEGKVNKLKKRLKFSHSIAGQLQQRPTSADGDLFKQEEFEIVDSAPDHGRACRSWDKASTTGNRSDYTAGVLVVDDGKDFYIVHCARGKWVRKDRERRMIKYAKFDLKFYPHYTVEFEQEGAGSGKDAAEVSADAIMASGIRVKVGKPLGKPKNGNAGGWESYCDLYSNGKIKLVKGPWNSIFIEEHLAAPNGRNDDQIEAAARAVKWLWLKRRKGKIRRQLLTMTDKEQSELQDKKLCEKCVGLGCDACGHTGFNSTIKPMGEIERILADSQSARAPLGVRW